MTPQPWHAMPTLLPVAVTATTEIIRGALRVRVNAAYTTALRDAGLLPLVLPVLDPADADAALDGVAGLVLTGGEDVTPGRYGSAPHPQLGDTHDGRDAFEIALVEAARARGIDVAIDVALQASPNPGALCDTTTRSRTWPSAVMRAFRTAWPGVPCLRAASG